MSRNCLICERIKLIKQNKNPFFVKELQTGFVVLGDHQFYKGYTLFLSKQHKKELHELDQKEKIEFLTEMSQVAQAVYEAFSPDKLNYELLGNTENHLHWHIFPRYANDPEPNKPIWVIDPKIRYADNVIPNTKERRALKIKLLQALTNHF